MIVAFDVDGVLANLPTAWLDQHAAATGERLAVTDLVSWDMAEHSRFGQKIYDVLADPARLYADVRPYDGAVEAVLRCRTVGLDVCFVTSCIGRGSYDVKMDWLIAHNFTWRQADGMAHDVIGAYAKDRIDADLLLDDRYENVRDFVTRGRGPLRLGGLVTRPWNADKTWPLRLDVADIPNLPLQYPSWQRTLREGLYAWMLR